MSAVVDFKIVVGVVGTVDYLAWGIVTGKATGVLLVSVVVCIMKMLQIVALVSLRWNIVAFIMSPHFLLVFWRLFMTWSNAVHEVWVSLVLLNLSLFLLVEVQILGSFSHVLGRFDSRNDPIMPNALNSAFCTWSWIGRNPKSVSYAWCTSNTSYCCYFLCSYLFTKSCWIHTNEGGSRWLVIWINPIIILHSIHIFKNLPFIRFTLDFFSCLQSSLLLDLIIFILISHLMKSTLACLMLHTKPAIHRVVDTASNWLILMRVRFVFAMSHICLWICLSILLACIFVSSVSNRTS